MKNTQSSPPEHRPARHAARYEPGFALLVTLSLLALLIVISLGFLSLSAVSLRSSTRGQAVAEAQANARMALMLAIGELQRELGPDKRVNASASIISQDGGKTTSAAPGRRHWISSHDSWNSTGDSARPSSHFRKWLVSGPESTTRDPAAPTAQDSDNVVLWSSMENDPNRVAVPKMPIRDEVSSRQKGSYAWWIGDENAKAMVSRLPDNLGNAALTRADAQSAPTSAYHHAASLNGIDRTSPNLDKLASHDTLDLVVPNVIRPADKSFHDFTNASTGLHTDVARGGFKRDLSLYLDHPVSEPLAPMLPNTRRLYPNGITWEELWLYHNVWRALEPPAQGITSTTGGDVSNSLVLMTKPGRLATSVSAFRSDLHAMYKLPVFLRCQWLVSVWATEKPNTNPTEYNLYWVSDGILTFWNPTDVPIALHPDTVISHKLWYLPYNIQIFDQNGLLATNSFRQVARGGSQPHQIVTMALGTGPIQRWGRRGTSDPVVLMPGEVLVMSEESASGQPAPYVADAYGPSVGLRAGWNLGAGTRVAISGLARPITAASNLRYRITASNDTTNSSTIVSNGVYYGADSRFNQPTADFYELLDGRQVAHNPPRASQHPQVFPSIQGDWPAVTAMTGQGKHPFFLFSHQTKSEDNPSPWSRTYNPRNTSASLSNLTPLNLAISGHEVQVDSLNGSKDSKMPQLSPNQINRGLFGGSYWDLNKGVDTVIIQSIPREAPISLGAFQHAIANGTNRRMSGGALSPLMSVMSPPITHAISNSYALPIIPPAQASSGNFTDHSYHVNRMLWDSWFLSSIVQRQSPHHTDKKTAREVYQDFLVNSTAHPLPNRRMKPTADAITDGADGLFGASHDPHELASTKLTVEGAFNANSTSAEAWKAILGSMEGIHIPVATDTNAPANAEAHQADGVPVHGLLTSYGSGTNRNTASFVTGDTDNAGKPAQWRGYRSLTTSEVDALATALVEEIRARGPFLSMADFINRRLDGSSDHTLCGPLQAALDRTINKNLFEAADRVGSDPTGVFINSKAAGLPKSMIAPLHVKQADILTSIGSQLTVRSDTFRIRAYGESVDRNGNVLAKAWCEALVQRLPQYVDPVDGPEAADAPSPDPEPRTVPPLTSETNRTFGRRLEVQSFRWLSPEEIQS